MKRTRREFVQAAAAATLCGGCSSLKLFGRRQPAQVIDTHVHFYDPSRPKGVPWPPKEDALLYRRTLPADYQELAVPQPVAGVVAVEASPWVEDNQWLLDLAAREPLIVGVVGNLLIGTDLFSGLLKRFAANPLYRGVRIRNGSLSLFVRDPAFIRDLTALAERGLCFDVHSPPEWVGQAERLSRAVPGLRLIVNHVANVAVTGGPPPDAWRRLMENLGRRPQVFMKVSGLVEGTGRNKGEASADVDFYRPVLETLWDTFGPDRLLYASDWPVSGRYAPLATVQKIATEFFAEKGQDALDKVFWKNAQTAYGLKLGT